MKKRIVLLLIPALCLLLTGCFEITETATFNADGSGHFTFTIDMSQSAQFIEMVQSVDTTGNAQQEAEFAAGIEAKKISIDSIDGISNMSVINEQYLFGLGFDFNSIYSLNKAMNRIFERTEENAETYFKQEGEYLIRNAIVEGSEDFNPSDSITIGLLKDARYSTNYSFNNEVASFSNDGAELSADETTLAFSDSFYNLLMGTSTLENKIKIKP